MDDAGQLERPLDLLLTVLAQIGAQGAQQLSGAAVVAAAQLLDHRDQTGQHLRVQSAGERGQDIPVSAGRRRRRRLWRRRRGRGRRLLLGRGSAALSGQGLGQLHDLRHAVGIGQQRIQFLIKFRHAAVPPSGYFWTALLMRWTSAAPSGLRMIWDTIRAISEVSPRAALWAARWRAAP